MFRPPTESTKPARARRRRTNGQNGAVANSVIVVLLLALAGFLIGGAFTTWKNSRVLSAVIGVCAVLAVVGAITWW